MMNPIYTLASISLIAGLSVVAQVPIARSLPANPGVTARAEALQGLQARSIQFTSDSAAPRAYPYNRPYVESIRRYEDILSVSDNVDVAIQAQQNTPPITVFPRNGSLGNDQLQIQVEVQP